MLGDDQLEQLLDRGLVRHVAHRCRDPDTRPLGLRLGLAEPVPVDVASVDRRPEPGKPDRDRPTDATRGAGDDHHLAVEIDQFVEKAHKGWQTGFEPATAGTTSRSSTN